MKKKARSKLIKELDKYFSQYTRMRYADADGIVACITCNKKFHYKKLHAGHYISRRCQAIRWNEYNVHPQCAGCNSFRNGEPQIYRERIVQLYGEDIAKGLLDSYISWQAGRSKKITTPEIEELIELYKSRVAEIEPRFASS